MYAADVIQFYVDSRFKYNSKTGRHIQTPPHTFAIAEKAFVSIAMQRTVSAQSIIISGESGAGKTEVAKQCLTYLAAVSMAQTSKETKQGPPTPSPRRKGKSSRFALSRQRRTRSTRSLLMMGYAPGVSSTVVDKIVSANPILEAFGNAKTLRNRNSSRFGKWLMVHFDARNAIFGCSSKSYLLEKSRVVSQAPGERNFHIFYMLLLGAPREVRGDLGLDASHTDKTPTFENPDSVCAPYHYVNQSGCVTVEDHEETAHFEEMLTALQTIGFTESQIDEILSIVAGILLFGNVNFLSTEEFGHGNDGSRVDPSTQEWLSAGAGSFGVPESDLAKWHTRTEIAAGKNSLEKIMKEHTPAHAHATRDATCKATYNSLFLWLVDAINTACGVPESGEMGEKYIGILDIFGFEIFEKNGFEQLCINYANEKLQAQFNASTFDQEMELYTSEGVAASEVADLVMPSNSGLVRLIGGKGGIFRILDDQVKLMGSDEGFFRGVIQNHSRAPAAKSQGNCTVFTKPGATWFRVKHFAGDVHYSHHGFVEKNQDDLYPEIEQVLATSSNSILAEVFKKRIGSRSENTESDAAGKRRRKKKKHTVGSLFCSAVDRLVKRIDSTNTHYVRCIKSNAEQKSAVFEEKYVLRQLRCSGLFEAAEIRKSGYPFRLSHADFWAQFKFLKGNGEVSNSANWTVGRDPSGWCHQFVEARRKNGSRIIFGSSMVLCSEKEHRWLQAQYASVQDTSAVKIEKIARGWLARNSCSENPQALVPPLTPPPPVGVAALVGVRMMHQTDETKLSADGFERKVPAPLDIGSNDSLSNSYDVLTPTIRTSSSESRLERQIKNHLSAKTPKSRASNSPHRNTLFGNDKDSHTF